jgi:hypothetical protein
LHQRADERTVTSGSIPSQMLSIARHRGGRQTTGHSLLAEAQQRLSPMTQTPSSVVSSRPASLSVEARLVLASAGGQESEGAVRELAVQVADWRRVLAVAAMQGAQPILARRLRYEAPDVIPPDLGRVLDRIDRAARHRQAYLARRMRDALELLASAGIRVMMLKGAALAHTTYATFADRPMSDLDLLVDREHAREAQRLLCDAGWRPRYEAYDDWYEAKHHHLPPLVDTRASSLAVGLELHVDILPPEQNPFGLSAGDLWDDAEPAPQAPTGTMVPSATHRLLHCAIHYTWSHMLHGAGWRTFRDVHAMFVAGQLDHDAIVQGARAAGAEGCVYWTLRLARTLGFASIPDGLLAALRPRWPEAVLRRLERHFAHETVQFEELCPSVLMQRTLLTAAMRPRAARSPAPRDTEWHGPTKPALELMPDMQLAGWQQSARGFGAWRRYLAVVI